MGKIYDELMKLNLNEEAAAPPAKIEATASSEETANAAASSTEKNITKRGHAEALFARMGVGRSSSVYVNGRDAYDKDVRAFRALVAEARKEGIPVVAAGDGRYWIADVTDPEDRELIERQIASLTSRAYETLNAAQAMKEAMSGRYMPKSNFDVYTHKMHREDYDG